MMNMKVCGITSIEQLEQLDKLFVDYAGFVFDVKSYQNVYGKIPAEEIKYADVDIKKVGVFTNLDYRSILETVKVYGLDLIQLNGSESPEMCKMLSKEIEVIKTFYIDDFDSDSIHNIINDYDDACDYYSFDSNTKSNRGGITNAFDWKMIGDTSIEKPFFIGGGGIKPSDAPTIHQFKHPDFFGVDINNNFEKEDGIKDTALVLSFMRAVNQVMN
jgi:phosphoribosylanthranilate isomerase